MAIRRGNIGLGIMSDMDSNQAIFLETLIGALARWSIVPQAAQLELLHAHFVALLEANRTFNLTRITDPRDAAIKHYADSLALLPAARQRNWAVTSVLDVGTGGGFPAVPLAIMRPDWRVTAIDSTGKKARFVASVAEALQLENLRVEHARAEHWHPRTRFSLVVLRAAGPMADAITRAVAHVARGGRLVVYQTPAGLAALRGPGESAVMLDAALTSAHLRTEDLFPYDMSLRDESISRTLFIARNP